MALVMTSPEKNPDMKSYKNLTLFRFSAFHFHDDRPIDAVNFSISSTTCASKLVSLMAQKHQVSI